MTNHLRIALKHLLSENAPKKDVTLANYKVCYQPGQIAPLVAIHHLNFKGREEFHTCQWNRQLKSLYICESDFCPKEEIVFVVKTIRKLGYEIEHIFADSSSQDTLFEEVSHRYEKYLAS